MTGDDIVRKIDERVVELRKALTEIEAEIARNSAVHREQAEQLGRDMDAIQAEVSRRVRQVINTRTEDEAPADPQATGEAPSGDSGSQKRTLGAARPRRRQPSPAAPPPGR